MEQLNLELECGNEHQLAQEEAYYWGVLHEFKVIVNAFGVKKVMADLQSIDLSKNLEEIIKENKKEIPKLLLPTDGHTYD